MSITHSAMTVAEAIDARRSVRSYALEAVDRASVRQLLAAAVRAPTAVHEEPWAFVIIQDRSTLKRLSDQAKPLFLDEIHRAHLDRGGHALDAFARPDFNIFYDAGTLIVIGAMKAAPFVAADCWLAAENLMLAARSMGLGTCVIGSALAALNLPEVKAELGVAADYIAIAPIIVGMPAGDAPATSRKEPRVLVWK
jgi:nitroreductase